MAVSFPNESACRNFWTDEKNLSFSVSQVKQSKAIQFQGIQSSSIVCQAASRDLSDQIKEFAAAEKRWTQQVVDGRVKALTAKEAGYNYKLADYIMLDVRPTLEREKAWVKGSMSIPAFDVDNSTGVSSVLDKVMMFAMGGWWSGAAPMKRNERFMADVVAKVPKSSNIIVCCQKGLRSLAACEHLYKAGYRNIYWLNGGLESADEDFEVEGPESLAMAGVGGMSAFLGFTDAQRKFAAKAGFSYRVVLFLRLLAVVAAADALFIGARNLPSLFNQ